MGQDGPSKWKLALGILGILVAGAVLGFVVIFGLIVGFCGQFR